MDATQYAAPGTVDEAVALLAGAGAEARVLAGGTDLIVQMRSGRLCPELLVDVKKIPELTAVAVTGDGGFRIGAAVSGAELGEHPELKAAWPGVVEAVELIGSTQIQGRASMGGNLCNGSPAADSVPALICASAVCVVAGPAGRREIAVENMIIAPGETALELGELLVELRLPGPAPRSGDAYLRFIPRSEMDIAVAGAGVSLTLDEGGRCTEARVALGAVAPTPLLVTEAADALIGTHIDDAALAALAAAASAACRPIDDLRGTAEYRTTIAGVLARRAAGTALERARSS